MMTTIGLLIRPLDVLLFREPRPFDPTDSASSTLPLPRTLAGMIRTHFMRAAGLTPQTMHALRQRQPDHWFVRYQVRGPWFCHHPGQGSPLPLVPLPADLAYRRQQASLTRLRPLTPDDARLLPAWRPSHPGLLPLWARSADGKPSTGHYLTLAGLADYLADRNLSPSQLCPSDELFVLEERTGIGVDASSQTAAESRIYSVRMLRLRPGIRFYAELLLPDNAPSPEALFPSGLTLPWGGEGRRADITRTSPVSWPTAPPCQGRRLSLLITPGVFHNAQYPWKPQERGQLLAAAVGKPLAVSGWDMAGVAEHGHRQRPRPTRYAVPAGAVYLWQTSHERTPPVVESLCDKPEDRDNGWGLALTGSWSHFNSDGKE